MIFHGGGEPAGRRVSRCRDSSTQGLCPLRLGGGLVLALFAAHAFSLTPLERNVQDSLSASFATASLLADSDVIKFGIWDFNPNDILDSEDEGFGSDESTELRQSLRQLSFPFRWQLSPEGESGKFAVLAKMAYLDVEREEQIFPSQSGKEDRIYQQVTSLGLGLGYQKPLDAHWGISLKGYATWMHYRNELDFNTPESRLFEPFLEDVIANIDIDLVMFEPIAGLHYGWRKRATEYRLFTDYHYIKGEPIEVDNPAHHLRPEAWYWSNGFRVKRNLAGSWEGHSLWFRLSRIDMGGDLTGQLGANHYYEAGVAWLIDAPESWSMVSNLGVGINLNYGSDLRGGTLIFLYNFDG
ncbi:Solitary outer membrane autotransporter beta-barrel domain [Pseudomaricurvus sp. HS19]|uniref:Solitary outer membrane autotransporter beta-barrel domain n=1 Tax=Pseudomaricurvus sp. HS19 TaxID=2692626 RepID=UPI001F2076CA|nr:Solitary outer membrane autotransporter beta-barrel domain [Pseudomaricurvus sp. HS19]